MSKRQTKQGQQKSAKQRSSKTTELKGRQGLSTGTKVVLIGAAVIMALSTVLGSLAYLFNGSSNGRTISSIEDVDSMYQAMAESAASAADANPEDTERLNAAAGTYQSWGQMASMFASTDEQTLHVNELFSKAIGYYDQSLALEDSADVRSSRAVALLYSGEGSAAESAMAETVEKFPDDASAWANYGMVLESRGSTDDAREAYGKAIALDTTEEGSARTYAESHLEALDQAEAAAATGESAGTGAEGLAEDLAEKTGTGL